MKQNNFQKKHPSLKIWLSIYSIALLFIISCDGKKIPSQEINKKTVQRNKQKDPSSSVKLSDNSLNLEKKESEILTPSEFTNAFSRKKFINKDAVKTLEEENISLPYKVNSLEKSLFNNSEFSKLELPPSSVAAKFHSNDQYSWAPKWQDKGRGGVLISDANISKDRSLLAILETIPIKNSKDKGTLIVLINSHNWTISKIHYYKKRLFKKIFLISKTNKCIIWEEGQGENSSNSIHEINVISGVIEKSSTNISNSLLSLTLSKNNKKLYLKTKNDQKNYYIFNSNNVAKQPIRRKCNAQESYIIGNNSSIVTIDKNKILTYKYHSNQIISEITNPIKNLPDVAIFANNNTIAYSSYMNSAAITINGKSKIISKASGKAMCYNANNNILAFEEYKNRQITFINLSDLSIDSTLIPNKIKPKTTASALLLSYLPHIDKYMILDNNGTLSLYNKPKKKWRKIIIFSPIK